MSLQKWQKIYVNRSLNMSSIEVIGFDMDHTLAMYNHVNFETLAFKATLQKFIKAGYPKQLAELSFDPTSVIRGLLVDRDRGNLLKVDAHKYVKLAFHGKRMLDKETRHKLYNAKSYKAQDLQSVDTFFSLSETQLFVEIVDFMDRHAGAIKKTFAQIYKELRKNIDVSHADGTIKKAVMANPAAYFNRDKHLRQTLLRLKEGGKKLFILTNSDFTYTDAVMSYLLHDEDSEDEVQHWRDFFDIVIVSARKPGFFTGKDPFQVYDPTTQTTKPFKGRKLLSEHIYTGGNAQLLQKYLAVAGDHLLYVGDHIYGDIISSKGLVNWRTMLIVEELERELVSLEHTRGEWEKILEGLRTREQIDEETQRVRSKLIALSHHLERAAKLGDRKKITHLERELPKMQAKLGELEANLSDHDIRIKALMMERSHKIHPVWGELMKVNLEKSRFASQVEQYACLYTSRVSNLRFYSPSKKFVSFHDLLPHEVIR